MQLKKISEFAFTKSGGTPSRSSKKFWGGEIPWLKSGELNDSYNIIENTEFINEIAIQNSSASVFPKGSLLLAMYGATAGKLGILGMDAATNQAVCSIQNRKGLFNERYLFNYLLYKREDIIKDSFGGAQPNISKTYIDNILVPLPSLETQEKIVSKLDELFLKIDKSILFLEENLKYSKALISSGLDEEFINLEAKYKKKPLAEIVTIINGRAYKQTEMFDNGKYPILRVGNFFSNRGWYYSDMELDENKYCETGDLLYAWSASFGPKIWDGEKSIYHYHIWKLVPTSDNVSKKFMYYLLERDTDKIKEEGGRGVGMIHITKGDIEKRMMVLPPIDIQEAAVSRIEKIYELHERLTIELKLKLDNMKALKSSLLDQAFKGEL